MMRLHFTEADLRKITLSAPNPLAEAALSVRLLRSAPGPGKFGRPGFKQLRRRLKGDVAHRAGVLADLVTSKGYIPDFLLQADTTDFAASVELVRETPAAELAAELALIPTTGRTSSLLRDLSSDVTAARQVLAGDLHGYFTSSIQGLWGEIQADAAADRALRAETLLRGGVDALLSTLDVTCRWHPPTLHIPMSADYDVPLCGYGLLLVPSYFATSPILGYRPGRSTVLMYPMYGGERPTSTDDALAPLLGRTRAAILAGLRIPATTTALARRAGISLGSASQHTAVLRNAGLISTTRTGSSVLHALTPLGSVLLQGDLAATGQARA